MTAGGAKRAARADSSARWQAILDSARDNFVRGDDSDEEDEDDVESLRNASLAKAAVAGAGADKSSEGAADAIRCVCGQEEEVEDDDKTFIQCDGCQVWQHAPCVGLTDDNIPDNYFCEQCRPDLHKKLLKRLAQARLQQHQRRRSSADVTARHKRRRSQATVSRTSDNEYEEDDDEADDATIVTDPGSETDYKARRASNPPPRKKASVGNLKEEVEPTDAQVQAPEGPYTRLDDIADTVRRNVAKALMNDLQKAAEQVKQESPQTNLGPDVENVLTKLAFSVEYAMFQALSEGGVATQKYKDKYRQLNFNLKDPKNPSLRRRVLLGTILPDQLASMSSEDMANPEAKALAEQLREESLRQSVLEVETGPRIRRTHKGEEIVDNVADEPINAISEATLPPREDRDVDLPTAPTRERARSDTPLSPQHPRTAPNRSSQTMDSPIFSKSPRQMTGPRDDPFDDPDSGEELHAMELDAAGRNTESAGYDMDVDRRQVWSGKVTMTGVSEFEAVATLIGGPDNAADFAWSDILPQTFQIDGRIGKPQATKYLNHQRFSSSKTVVALLIEVSAEFRSAHDNLFDYFTAKDRFGVLKPNTKAEAKVRDGYLVPLRPADDLPEFVETMPMHAISTTRKEHMMLAILVVEKSAAATTTAVTAADTQAVTEQGTNMGALPKLDTSGATPGIGLLKQQSSADSSEKRSMPSTPAIGASTPTGFAPAQRPPAHARQKPAKPQAMPSPAQASQAAQTAPVSARSPLPPHSPGQPPSSAGSAAPAQLTQSDTNVLLAFLQANPTIASDPAVTSNPELLSRLLLEFTQRQAQQQQQQQQQQPQQR